MSKKTLNTYRLSTKESIEKLNSDKNGLSKLEAEKRLNEFGPNKLDQISKDSKIKKYFRQYKDLMIVLLLVSALLSVYLGDIRTGLILLILVMFNTTIGFIQEYNAEKIMDSLSKLIVAGATVRRGGKIEEVPSTDLVVGDIVYVEEGNSVPADMRIIEESELSSNDFALTGESNPSRKFTHTISSTVPLANRHNQLYMGTTIATGHCYGLVFATGMNTELGRIANLSQSTKETASPLQKEMKHTATRVTQGTLILCLILMLIAIKDNMAIKDAFLFAIGIASSLIPQGLPAEINTALAQAANKLAKAQALVKKLSAVESLGSTNVICTDKTGTLTKNEMTVQQFTINQTIYKATGTGYAPDGSITDEKGKEVSQKEIAQLDLFFNAGVFASNAHINPPDEEHDNWHCLGDPTEGALIVLAKKANYEPNILEKEHPELKEFAFDSSRKLMSSIRKWKDGELYVFVKGAPENVLKRSTRIWSPDLEKNIEKKDIDYIVEKNESLAKDAMRNLAYAYKKLPKNTNITNLKMEDVEANLTWIGMVSIIDPPRKEVSSAIRRAQQAGVKVSIITGDNATTARAIAERVGLGRKNKIKIIHGEELSTISSEQIVNDINNFDTIFSRVSPEEKLRIVESLKLAGKVVAVTGDGINDAPALKMADIGVAMGKTGTDVAKQSAKIILLDDSFNSLVKAIEQGRGIFQNIKKGTLSCFTSNSAELVINLISLGFFSLMHVPLALTIMEILAIDIIAELFPIVALGNDPADHDLMKDKPRNQNNHIINKYSILDLLWCGALIGGFAFLNYIFLYLRNDVDPSSVATGSAIHMQATAITYLTVVLCQLTNIIQRRSSKGIFTKYQLKNRRFWLSILLSIFCVVNVIYNPLISPYFGAGPLSFADIVFTIIAVLAFLSARELQRLAKTTKLYKKALKFA